MPAWCRQWTVTEYRMQKIELRQDRIGRLMAAAWRLRDVLDSTVPDDRYDPKVHLARRYAEILAELEAERVRTGLARLKCNVDGVEMVYTAQLKGGIWKGGSVKSKARLGGG